MLRVLLRSVVAVCVRAVAAVFGLLAVFYFQLVGDVRTPVAAQLGEAIARLRELARALETLG